MAAQDSETFDVCYGEAHLDVREFYEFLDRTIAHGVCNVICESFEFRQGKQHAGVDLYPRELIGILNLYYYDHSDKLYFQPAWIQGDKKDVYFSDAKLKELNLYLKGVGHGRSAVKHLLWWFYFGAGFNLLAHPEQSAELVEEDWFLAKYLKGSVPDSTMQGLDRHRWTGYEDLRDEGR